MNDIETLAANCGFTNFGPLDVSTIRVVPEVRDMCAANKCKAYDANWSCPPACGTLDECEAVIRKYKRGYLLQTTALLEDSFDIEGIEAVTEKHQQNMDAFARGIKDLYPSSTVMGAGACRRCEPCSYPDMPCRNPDTMIHSMEAMGMLVSEVCEKNNLPYYYGKDTLTYTGCVLLD